MHPALPLLRNSPPLVHLTLEVARPLLDLRPPVAVRMLLALVLLLPVLGENHETQERGQDDEHEPESLPSKNLQTLVLNQPHHHRHREISPGAAGARHTVSPPVSCEEEVLEAARPAVRQLGRACPSRACARGGRSRCGRPSSRPPRGGGSRRRRRDRAPREAPQELAHLADARGVEAVRRLVEDEDGRVRQERLRDADALAHPERVRPHEAVEALVHVDEARELVDPSRGAVPDHPGEVLEVLAAGQELVEVGRLDDAADLAHRGLELALEVVPVDDDAAARGPHEADEHPDRRRLPRAVRAEETRTPRPGAARTRRPITTSRSP